MFNLLIVYLVRGDKYIQLNKYETAPNFILLNQNLTWDCLLLSVFLPILASCDHKIVLF